MMRAAARWSERLVRKDADPALSRGFGWRLWCLRAALVQHAVIDVLLLEGDALAIALCGPIDFAERGEEFVGCTQRSRLRERQLLLGFRQEQRVHVGRIQ